MKKIIIVTIAVAFVAAVGWFAYQSGQKTPAETPPATTGADDGDVNTADTPVKPDQSVAKPDAPRPQSRFYVKPETIPAGFEGFYETSQMKRLDLVTDEMNKTEAMSPETFAFFKAELFNRDHLNVTRNNMGNALVRAYDGRGNHPDPDLHEAFITMLDDTTEDPVWRDYCLQFLSGVLPTSSDPERIKAVIARYAEGDDTLAGTAVIHMALLDRDRLMALDESFNERLAEQLESPAVQPATKLSIIGILGDRRDVKQLPVLRKYAKQNENAGLKRTAIAALATIGASSKTKDVLSADDRAIIKAGLKHKNRGVQMAAKDALKRLEGTNRSSK